MSVSENLEQPQHNVNVNFVYEAKMQKIREELLAAYANYGKTIAYMAADAPISILCLPRTVENILLKHGFNRVYDIINMDFTKIKGFGVQRSRQLTTSLHQFLAML